MDKKHYLNESEIFKAAVSHEACRLLLGLLMTETGVFQTCAMKTPEQTYLCEGERNVGLRILKGYLASGLDPIKSMKEYEAWLDFIEKNRQKPDISPLDIYL